MGCEYCDDGYCIACPNLYNDDAAGCCCGGFTRHEHAVTPRRIQMSRKKGARLPEGAVVVARPSRWGNPYRLGPNEYLIGPFGSHTDISLADNWRGVAARKFREDLMDGRLDVTPDDVVEQLAGRDLVCWCPLDQPCHADVLLDVANGG